MQANGASQGPFIGYRPRKGLQKLRPPRFSRTVGTSSCSSPCSSLFRRHAVEVLWIRTASNGAIISAFCTKISLESFRYAKKLKKIHEHPRQSTNPPMVSESLGGVGEVIIESIFLLEFIAAWRMSCHVPISIAIVSLLLSRCRFVGARGVLLPCIFAYDCSDAHELFEHGNMDLHLKAGLLIEPLKMATRPRVEIILVHHSIYSVWYNYTVHIHLPSIGYTFPPICHIYKGMLCLYVL